MPKCYRWREHFDLPVEMAYEEFPQFLQRFPSLQKIATTSEKVTLAVNIDLDGTTVKIGGTIDPSTILKAMASNGTSLDLKSNDKYDQVSIILESTCCKK